jgi:hypothetical protein
MRIALALLALSGVAHADGAYVVGDGGGTAMRGDLARYHATVRYRVGVGVTHGDWAIEGWYAADRGDLVPFEGGDGGCGAEACPVSAGPVGPTGMTGALSSYGVDLRRAFTLVDGPYTTDRQRWLKPRVQLFLHGGLREARGDIGMTGLSGAGAGVGAGLDVAMRVFSAYIEMGADRFDLGPGASDALTFHVVIGERIGFSM